MTLSRVQGLRSVHHLGCSQMDCSLLSTAFLGFNDGVCRVDDLAAAEELGGIKKIFGYIGCLFKHGKGDESFQNSMPGEGFIQKTK